MTARTETMSEAGPAARRLRVVSTKKQPVRARSPRPTSPLLPNAVLGVLVFIAAEIMLFAGLISVFVVLRANAEVWPPPGQPRLPVGVTAINTLVLLVSGATMLLAHARRDSGAELRRWLVATVALGSLFLLVQGSEWIRLLGYGMGLRSGNYGGTFYALIGCHGLHVLGGMVSLVVVLRGVLSGRYVANDPGAIQAATLFWCFVVGIWPLLYYLVYLS